MNNDPIATANILLNALTPDDVDRLRPLLTRRTLRKGQVLVRAESLIRTVHFMETGIASIVSARADEVRVGLATIGREGATGVAVLMGTRSSPHETICQTDGAISWSLEVDALMPRLPELPSLQDVVLRYVHTLVVQMAANAAANASDRLDARLARRLLMCHDRVDGDEIPLTHSVMATMLGTHRSAVTSALHILEGDGSIRARRQWVTIANRERLERTAGASYGAAEAEYTRLIAPFGKGGSGLVLMPPSP